MSVIQISAPDRRAALKERHRQAIIGAAASLMAEHGALGFTVDDLAARADVSRRTVFNHFAAVDDIVAAVCADVLSGVVDSVVAQVSAAPAAGGSTSAVFDEVAHALRTTDLVTPMAYLTRTLGPPDEQSTWRAALMLRSFHEVNERFASAMAARHPHVDVLDVQLLVNSLMSGLMMLYGHWFALTGAVDDGPARRVWAALVDRLVETVRHGYGTPPPTTP